MEVVSVSSPASYGTDYYYQGFPTCTCMCTQHALHVCNCLICRQFNLAYRSLKYAQMANGCGLLCQATPTGCGIAPAQLHRGHAPDR